MGRGLPYRFFDAVARYPYSVADVIGVQTPGNKGYFAAWTQRPGRRLEVLQNWLGAPADAPSTIVVGEKDKTTPPFHTEWLHNGIAGSKLRSVAGKGHMLNWEAPEVLIEEIVALAA